LLKIDVQGSELEVLKGASRVLRECKQVLVECSFAEFYVGQALFHDVYTYLINRDFRMVAAYCSARDRFGAWLQADILFDAMG